MANTYNQEHLVFLNLQVKSSSFVPMRSLEKASTHVEAFFILFHVIFLIFVILIALFYTIDK